jgi:hypothetical protein
LKQASSILLLFILFFYQVGNFLVFTIVKHLEKEKLEAHILRNVPENECEIIKLSDTNGDFHWEKQDEIFYLDNVMYDVTKKKIINGEVYLYCIKETKEIELLDDLSLKITGTCDGDKAYNFIESDEYIVTWNDNIRSEVPQEPAYSRYLIVPLKQVKNIILPPPRPAC